MKLLTILAVLDLSIPMSFSCGEPSYLTANDKPSVKLCLSTSDCDNGQKCDIDCEGLECIHVGTCEPTN